MTTAQRLTGRIQVGLPPGEAFRLFTPAGEEDWAHGWKPRFLVQAPDDTEPGTVFAEGYPAYLQSWQHVISALLSHGQRQHRSEPPGHGQRQHH